MLNSYGLASIFLARGSPPLWAAYRRTLAVSAPLFPAPCRLLDAVSFPFRSNRRRQRSKKKDRWWAPKTKVILPRASELDAVSTERISSAYGYPEYSRLLPCPSHNTSPRIEHLVATEGGNVLAYISRTLNLPSMYVADLIRFGAVHYALVCPKPPPSATPEQVQIYREVTEPSVLQKRTSLKGKTVREAQKTFRITDADEFIEAGTYLRVHVHPKRFPR